MAFATDVAALVTDQLSRFVTLNRHQLAGQVANLEFWLAEARHAREVIDGYCVRYVRLYTAQELYVEARDTAEFTRAKSPEFQKPPPLRRVPDRELQKAKRALTESFSRFLTRCHQEGLISESQLSAAWARVGLDPHDER